VGYGYILSENYTQQTQEKIATNEHRIFQQFIANNRIGAVSLTHRYRFEQRFVEEDFKMRVRYFLAAKIPLIKFKDDLSMLYLSTYNEVFLNTKSAVFDRNRVYLGVGYQLNKQTRIEAGYMNQLFESSSRDQFNLMTLITF
jgi:hypothetical protein